MRRILTCTVFSGILVSLAAVVSAEDLALVIGNRTHLSQPDLPDSARLRDAKEALDEAGFTVLYGQNLTTRALQELAGRFRDQAKDAEHVVIVLSGHWASTSRDTWLLGADALEPDSFSVGGQGLSLGGLLDIAAQHQGASLIAMGENQTKPRIGAGVQAMINLPDLPQGVTLVRGPVAGLMRFLTRQALLSGQSIGVALDSAPRGVVGAGFVSRLTPFLPDDGGRPAPVPADAETSFWQAVQSIGSIEALLSYVERYPDGRYVADANRKIGELRAAPQRRARQAEDALHLNREQRRQIQRNLSILGFNPRGVDGIFGRGTRAAVSAWQRENGFDETGFLTGNQIAALQNRADVKARELEEEARRRQEEHDRNDAAYWRRTGRGGTEDDLRAYLKRYPDGLYSEIAQARLDTIEDEKRAQVQADERALWDETEAADTADAYRRYLQTYPKGTFAQIANGRLQALEADSRNEAARQEEARIAGNPVTRLLVEKRLQELGLKPGRIDGRLDENTRKAIRKFQRSRKIPATGYITQQTIVRLLAAR